MNKVAIETVCLVSQLLKEVREHRRGLLFKVLLVRYYGPGRWVLIQRGNVLWHWHIFKEILKEICKFKQDEIYFVTFFFMKIKYGAIYLAIMF